MRSGASRKPLPPSRSLVPWRKFYLQEDYRNPKGKRTICEVLRELYREARSRGDISVMQRLDECHDMAKRMQRKLMQYNRHEIYPSIEDTHITGDSYGDHPQYGFAAKLEGEDCG